MPDSSDDASARIERELFLRTFANVGPRAAIAAWLADAMDDAYLDAGATLFRAGDPADYVYFIVRGEVELRDEDGRTWRFGERALLGALDAVLERRLTKTAVARTEVHALVLRAEDWFDQLEDNFEYARTAVLGMAAALHEDRLALGGSAGFPEAGPSPPPPGRPLSLVERMMALRGVSAFKRAGIQALTELAGAAEELRLEPGEVLFRPGSFRDLCFVVARGVVRLERETPRVLARFGAPSLVGGVFAIGPGDEHYTATAETAAVVLKLREEDFFDVMELHFDLTRSVLADLARERDRLLQDIASEDGRVSQAEPVHGAG